MRDDSEREERGKSMWGHFESLWGHMNTHARARSPTPMACCAALDNTVSSYERLWASVEDKTSHCSTASAYCLFFSQQRRVSDFFNFCSKKELENETLSELLGRKPAYNSQRISFRKRISAKYPLSSLFFSAAWRLDTKWLPGEKWGVGGDVLAKRNAASLFQNDGGVRGSPVSQPEAH